jgi:hypothetical protein
VGHNQLVGTEKSVALSVCQSASKWKATALTKTSVLSLLGPLNGERYGMLNECSDKEGTHKLLNFRKKLPENQLLSRTNQKKKKHVLSTTVQILDVITSFNLNCYPGMMYRRKKIMK